MDESIGASLMALSFIVLLVAGLFAMTKPDKCDKYAEVSERAVIACLNGK